MNAVTLRRHDDPLDCSVCGTEMAAHEDRGHLAPELNGIAECGECGRDVCPECWGDSRCCEATDDDAADRRDDNATERGLDDWRGC